MTPPYRGAVLLLVLAAACRDTPPPGAAGEVLAGAEVMVSEESELLSVPVDLAVDERGRLYVADEGYSYLLRVDPGGGAVALGRQGSGPAEFNAPQALSVRGDTVRVDDRGNGRVVVLDGDAHPVRAYSLPARLPGPLSFGARGEAAVAGLGLSSEGLVRMMDAEGRPTRWLGDLVVRSTPFLNFTIMKADVRRGRVPDVLRNSALPALDEQGGAWVSLSAEGEVRRYDAAGMLRWRRRVLTPEMASIRKTFFALNREEPSPAAFHPLQYFADSKAVGNELWLLIATPDDVPSTVLVIGDGGQIARRYVLADVPGARSLAVDPARRRLYLTSPTSAAVVAVTLPAR